MQSIDIFPWDDHFKTGIDTIDEQHHKLVDILNKLATNVANESSQEDLSHILDELTDYTRYHFQTEEEIWNKYLPNTSMSKEHEEIHRKFVDKIVDLKSQKESKSLSVLTEEAFSFLTKWLASHILDTDRHMAHIVFALQDGLGLDEAKNYARDKMSGSNRILIDIILSVYSTFSSNTLSLMREIKAHRFYETKVQYQDSYRQLLLKIAASFINLPVEQLSKAIDNALESIATFVNSDRAYIFEYDRKENTTSNTHEWCAEGIEPQIEELQNLPIDFIPEWEASHSRGENILIEDVVGMKECGVKEILMPQEVKSLVSIPLMQEGSCIGFAGFDAVKTRRDFSKNEIEFLDLFGKLLVNVTNRLKAEEELFQEKTFLKNTIQTIPDLMWLKDLDGNYLSCNKRFEDFFGAKEEDIVGKKDYDFLDKEVADSFSKSDKIVIQTRERYLGEKELFFASDGHKEIVETTKIPMFSSDNTLIGVLGVARDITLKQELKKNLVMERDRFKLYLDTVEAVIVSLDTEGKITLINRKGCELLGYTEEELLGEFWFKKCLLQPEGMDQIYPLFLKIITGELKSTEYNENEIKTKSGEARIIAWHNTILRDADGNISGSLTAGEDITERKKSERHLKYIAHYDALTGLPNRVLFSDRINQILIQARRYEMTFAVVYLDLDGFKEINDTYGHDYGDKLLSLLSKNMQNSLREGDTIARLGGDEFVVVLQNLNTHEESAPMLKRLLKECSRNLLVDTIEMQVTASLGVTFFDSKDNLDVDQLLRQADQAMYQAKLLGKNRYHVFDAVKDKKIRTHHESIEEISKALENEEFVLYYQPKVNMKRGEIIGAEALVRWKHPKRGILAPAKFLPIIQESDLSVKLGSWILERVMKQIEEFKSRDINLPISINVDAMQLQQNDFMEQLKNLLVKYPTVKPADFILEILETSALEDMVHISQIMQTCRNMGISFSLDDFGTGYSSLTYLKRLPAKELKIDQSFVRGMLEDSEDLAILEGVLGLSNAFRRQTIAEGVETLEHGEMLLKLGCENAQGYVIARPMPVEELPDWIRGYTPNEKWKNTSRINRDELPLLYALVEHKSWLKNVFLYLDNIRKVPPQLKHRDCRFGEWLYENGVKRYKNSLEFQKLVKLHIEVHQSIDTLIRDTKENDTKDFTQTRDKITRLSKSLEDSFRKCELAKNRTIFTKIVSKAKSYILKSA